MILTASGAEYDPERTLWKPGRRAFFFFGLGAVAGAVLPDVGLEPIPPIPELWAKMVVDAHDHTHAFEVCEFFSFADMLQNPEKYRTRWDT